MSTENTEGQELVNAPEFNEAALAIFNKVKACGLSISIFESKKNTEPCAYQNCKDNALFCMEELLVCTFHAQKLLKCFVPEK